MLVTRQNPTTHTDLPQEIMPAAMEGCSLIPEMVQFSVYLRCCGAVSPSTETGQSGRCARDSFSVKRLNAPGCEVSLRHDASLTRLPSPVLFQDLMKSEERQKQAKERREEKAKYLGEWELPDGRTDA